VSPAPVPSEPPTDPGFGSRALASRTCQRLGSAWPTPTAPWLGVAVRPWGHHRVRRVRGRARRYRRHRTCRVLRAGRRRSRLQAGCRPRPRLGSRRGPGLSRAGGRVHHRGARVGSLVALARLAAALGDSPVGWRPLVAVLGAATTALGNLAALWQDDVGRLLGWSAVTMTGCVLMGVVAVGRCDLAVPPVLYSLLAYVVGKSVCLRHGRRAPEPDRPGGEARRLGRDVWPGLAGRRALQRAAPAAQRSAHRSA